MLPSHAIESPEPLRSWLQWVVEVEASDLHLVEGCPPVARVHGQLRESPGGPLAENAVEDLLPVLCPADRHSELPSALDLDCSYETNVAGCRQRFRVNLFRAQERWGACLRLIPGQIPGLDWAGFPQDLADRLAALRDGLVIFSGVTGAGKSTSLAMIVDRLCSAGGSRVVTIEEPIEYRFPLRENSIITQREVGRDVEGFAAGLRSALRQDPDVILVGEIRDRETAQIALSAAETGHLIFTTLHTRDCKGAVTRFADLFPHDAQKEVRGQLSHSLKCVVSQRLLPSMHAGEKRVLALEVLWNTFPIATAIRQAKIESIDNYLMTAREDGMLSFDESIRQLLRSGRISRSTATEEVSDPSWLNR